MASRRTTALRPAVLHLHKLSIADARGSAAVYPGLPEDLSSPSRAGTAVRHGPEQGPSVDACPVGCPTGDAARAGGGAYPVLDRVGEAPRGDRGGRERDGRSGAGAAERIRSARSGTCPRLPPFGHDGTERRIRRPQDPTEQAR